MFWFGLAMMFLLLVLARAAALKPFVVSAFELERLKASDSESAKRQVEGWQLRPVVVGLLTALQLGLLIGVALTSFNTWGAVWGWLVSGVVVIGHLWLGQLKLVQRFAQWFYQLIEAVISWLVNRVPLLKSVIYRREVNAVDVGVSSRDELINLVQKLKSVVSKVERERLLRVLAFSDKKVAEVMTPRDQVVTIADSEILGPLVLDRLYGEGQSVLPVTDGDSTKIIGVLRVKDNLIVTGQTTPAARDVMQSDLVVVEAGATLEDALRQLRRAHQELAIVVGEEREPVGVVSLDTVLESLI